MGQTSSETSSSRWRWIPSLYFAQGIPYVAVMTLAVVMYKNLGVSNTDVALYTSWLYLPWVIKPLWSPLVDLLGSKRLWIIALQFVIGAGLAGVALLLPGPWFFRGTLAVFWLVAFASATHDIAADGFYLLALPADRQAAFVGVRSTFYRLAMIAGQGGLVWLAGAWTGRLPGGPAGAWAAVFGLAAGFFALVATYHALALPRPHEDVPRGQPQELAADWWRVLAAFFRRKDLRVVLGFLLLYRFAEAQLLKLVPPFLLDARGEGGLGLSTQEVGFLYGTVGVMALVLGGIAGGVAISQWGLRRLLWPMILAMYVPNLVFVSLALVQPAHPGPIGVALAVEQFGYGFGFTAYMVYMMWVAAGSGAHRTAHYALCTGFMALGMMVPGMWAGWLQEKLGYVNFFVWVLVATVPSFLATAAVVRQIDPAFGTAPSARR